MAFEEGHGAEAGSLGNKTMRGSHRYDGFQHWKYPETVGNDTVMDDINFNSHQSSEYSVERMSTISGMTHEPFMLFEFMKIDESASMLRHKSQADAIAPLMKMKQNVTITDMEDKKEQAKVNAAAVKESAEGVLSHIKQFVKNVAGHAKRDYTGSIALYMPTDIQINDSMGYNEDTRKLGAALEGLTDGKTDILNPTVLTDPAVLALAGAAIGMIPAVPALVSTVLGGSIGGILSTEIQKATGKIMNPNELLRYQNTALRSFSFSWIILPDSENESKQAAGLIKFFRKSAHANKNSSTIVTVPDHVVTSFHGGGKKDVAMIQLPPCYIESVNVTYNPNNSSFFKQNNAPVEIGLAVTLKEIIPIYAKDVEDGY